MSDTCLSAHTFDTTCPARDTHSPPQTIAPEEARPAVQARHLQLLDGGRGGQALPGVQDGEVHQVTEVGMSQSYTVWQDGHAADSGS